MKLLVNDKEIAHFLNYHMEIYEKVKVKKEIDWTNLEEFIADFNEKMSSKKVQGKKAKHYFSDDQKKKFADKLRKAIIRDVDVYKEESREYIRAKREYNFHKIHNNIEEIISKIGIEKIFELYKKSPYKNFVKGTGFTLDPSAKMMRRKEFNSYKEDALIRNTVGNEELLVTKVDNNYPMWFIDSGYTNFLEPSKKWHRLVRNHLHYGDYFDAPAYRLENFVKFPVPWRKTGDKIYIIEPGPFAAGIFHCDLKTWKYDVEAELRKYTDKKIVFREKKPLRERTRLFDELLNDDYYCVISINSNAATEAIWAGIPAITMGRHITNPVTKSKLSDINDLYYGSLGSWLCMLSYSQFTKEELMNGTAHRIIKKYHV